MYLITNLTLLIVKASALLSSSAIDAITLSRFIGKDVGTNHKARILGFVTLFLISSLVYLVLL